MVFESHIARINLFAVIFGLRDPFSYLNEFEFSQRKKIVLANYSLLRIKNKKKYFEKRF